MLKLLTLISIAASAPITCDVPDADLDTVKANRNWCLTKIREFQISDNFQRYIKYNQRHFTLNTSEDLKLFNSRLGFMDKLRSNNIGMNPVACRMGSKTAVVINASGHNRELLSESALINMSGIRRSIVYLRMAILLQDALRVGAFLKRLARISLMIAPSDPYTAQLNIFEDLYPQKMYLEDTRREFLEKQLITHDVDFLRFHPKYVLKEFIEDYEELRRDCVKREISRQRGALDAEGVAALEALHPLPEFLVKLIEGMLDPAKTLDEIVAKMEQEIKVLKDLLPADVDSSENSSHEQGEGLRIRKSSSSDRHSSRSRASPRSKPRASPRPTPRANPRSRPRSRSTSSSSSS